MKTSKTEPFDAKDAILRLQLIALVEKDSYVDLLIFCFICFASA